MKLVWLLDMDNLKFARLKSSNPSFFLRTHFIESGLDENLDCVEESAAAQHMETSNEQKRSVSNYRRRALLSKFNFYAGVEISGQFERSSPACLRLDFYYR